MSIRATHTTTASTPLGDVVLVGTPDALTGLWFAAENRHVPGVDPAWIRDHDAFSDAVGQLGEYFAGARTTFDLRLDTPGTEFQQAVWAALGAVPHGTTISYADLARRAGRPGAARAAGAANGRNPISIIIPCHRVVAASGRLTDYGGGLARKRALLTLEGAHLPA